MSREVVDQLRDILGPAVTDQELRQLLLQAHGSVQGAVDTYFTSAVEPFDLTWLQPGPSNGVAQTAVNAAPAEPSRGLRATRPTSSRARRTSMTDFVELSSSTDNDYDPAATSSEPDPVPFFGAAVSSGSELSEHESNEGAANNHLAAYHVGHNTGGPPNKHLKFDTVRDHVAKQGRIKLKPTQLPFPDLRSNSGRLFCGNDNALPEAASQTLKYPIHLGTFKFPVRMAVKGKAAANKPVPVNDHLFLGPLLDSAEAYSYAEGSQVRFYRLSKSLNTIQGRIVLQLMNGKGAEVKPVAVVPINPDRYSELGFLFTFLEELQHRNAIKLNPKLAAGPPNAQLLEAANLKKSCRYSDNMHAEVEVLLLESAVPTLEFAGQVAQKGKGKRKRGDPNQKWVIHDAEMDFALNWLLMTNETSLAIGPDSDGLLNFCDSSSKSAATGSPADATASAKSTAASASSRGKTSSRRRGKQSPDPSPARLDPPQVTVQQMLDSVALPDDAAVAVVPSALRTIPKHFQLQGLQWMLAREQLGDALNRGHLHLHPEWIQLVTADKQVLYWNRMSSHFCASFVPAEVGGTCGGFLCDEMGLGKTLQSLMLILSNPAPESWPVADLRRHEGEEGEAVPIKTTLIVMPANLLQQWQDEISKHVQHGSLSWCIYDSQANSVVMAREGYNTTANNGVTAIHDMAHMQPRRTRSQRTVTLGGSVVKVVDPIWGVDEGGKAVQMQHQDIALMTYEQLRKELSNSDRSPLLQFGFWRVMLDEAQLVAATSSVAAQMTSSLWRRHAWVVTGTPITSRLGEIQGLLEFLAYEPFYHNDQWHKLLEGPLEGSHPEGSLPLKALMQGVMLRRTKTHVGDQLALPPCEHVEKWVPLSSVEQSFYDRLLKQVMSSLAQYQAAAKRRRSLSSRASQHAVRMVRQFTELRQCCCHPQIVRGATSMLGKGRLSMQAIMERLTAKAYDEYDGKVRAHIVACLLQEAVAVSHGSKPSTAFLGVLQQIMAATENASELDVAMLIQYRSPDGLLPSSSSDDTDAPGTAALSLTALLQSKAGRQAAHSEAQGQPDSVDTLRAGLELPQREEPPRAGSEQPQRAILEQPSRASSEQPRNTSQTLAAGSQTNGYVGRGSEGTGSGAQAATKSELALQQENGVVEAVEGLAKADKDVKATGSVVDFLLGQRGLHHGTNPSSSTVLPGDTLHQLPNGLVRSADNAESSGKAETDAKTVNEHGQYFSSAVGGQGGMLTDEDMTQSRSKELGPHQLPSGTHPEDAREPAGSSNGLPDQDTAQPPQHTAEANHAMTEQQMGPGPSRAGPDQLLGQAPEQEAGPSSRQEGAGVSDQASGHTLDEEAEPSSSRQRQKGTSVPQQRKRKFGSIDQRLEEEEDPEVKERKENARGRHRAWRKILLDGLDLLFELTQAAASANPADTELSQGCQVVEAEAQALRSELGLDPELVQQDKAPRFSKRARQMAPETELAAAAAMNLSMAHAAHLRAAKLILKAYDDLRAKRSSRHSAALAVKSSQEALKAKWRTVQHLHHKQLDAAAQAKGKAVAPAPTAAGQSGEAVAQEDVNTCPICLDECASRTVTACGHYYCSACIHELVEGGGQGGGVPCPLCRAPLQAGDLYDAVTDEEAEEARKAASVQGDYGSKVSTLLLELAAMKQADPTAKAVVFSSWSRLLRLVEEALGDNGFTFTSIAGVQASARAAALKSFLTNPDCSVLTVIMSTGGGASGLTLTVASHVFLMEPNLNPGLEAQAAGRVYRLGQTKPTRVIRLLTEGTIEKPLLAYQRSKVGSANQQAEQLQEQELLAGNTLADLLAAHP